MTPSSSVGGLSWLHAARVAASANLPCRTSSGPWAASVSTHTAGQFPPPEFGSVPKKSNAMIASEKASCGLLRTDRPAGQYRRQGPLSPDR